MFLRYGSFSHEVDEAAVVIAKTALLTEAGVPYAILHRWSIRGRLTADDQAGITTAIRNLAEAYSVPGKDISIRFDSGSTSAHQILSSQAVGGVRIIEPPSFPIGDGAQYSTFRDYTIVVEAEVPTGLSGSSFLLWVETINFSGGGPRDVYIETINGPPQLQRVNEFTVFRASQSGSAVGYRGYPIVPGPIWPGAEIIPDRQISYRSPRASGRGSSRSHTEYPVTWSYQFHSAVPLNGLPRRQPS